MLPRWRTGKPARGRYLFYTHFISILIVIQYQRLDLRTLYAFLHSSLVSLSQKLHRYGYGGIISSPFVYILIFSDDPNMYISFLCRIVCIFLLSLQNQISTLTEHQTPKTVYESLYWHYRNRTFKLLCSPNMHTDCTR